MANMNSVTWIIGWVGSGDVARVDGQLAVARAFGDLNLKVHLSSEPDVIEEIIDEDTECVILASDGLWIVMSNQEAVDSIKDVKGCNVSRQAFDRGGCCQEEQG